MKNIILLISIAALTACGVSSSDGVVSRGKNSSGFMGLSENAAIEVDGGSALKGMSQVVIGSFKVGFVESSVSSNQAGGGLFGGGFGGKASGKSKLTGVSEATKKSITNAAYSHFLSTLKSNGFTVASRSKYTASGAYKDAKKYSFPYEADDSGFLSEYGVTRFYQPAALGSQGVMFMNDIPGVTGGFAFGNGEMAAAEFAKENGLAVVSATYIVDFAAADGHGGTFSQTASVQVGQNLSVTQGSVKFVSGATSTFTSGTATVSIGQPIQSDKTFATISDETSSANQVAQEASNVLSAVLGGGTSRSKEYVFKANPSKYKSITTGLLKDANKAAISKAASLR